jgi:hypothetical protein
MNTQPAHAGHVRKEHVRNTLGTQKANNAQPAHAGHVSGLSGLGFRV